MFRRLVISFFIICCFLTMSNQAFASGVPSNYNVNVNVQSFYVGANTVTVYSFTAPAGDSIQNINLTVSPYYTRDNAYWKIKADGSTLVSDSGYGGAVESYSYTGNWSIVTVEAYSTTGGQDLTITGNLTLLTYVASEATVIQAKDAATNAMNAANSAKSSADAANSNAIQAKNNAANAMNNSYYNGTYGGSSESVGNIAGYIRNKQLPDLETKINNLQVAVSSQPPDLQCSWQNGATITNSAREAILNVATSDSNATLAYSIDGGATYTTFTGNSVKITFPSTPKYATVYVRATNQSGKQTIKTLSIFVQ